MNLRENINNMMQIAYKADKNFGAARSEFATAVSNQQLELIELANKVKISTSPEVVNTFSDEYINLFRAKFLIIDELLDSVINSGAVSEDAFASTTLNEIGIDNTDMRSEYISTGMMWPIAAGESITITTLCKHSMPFELWPGIYKTKACNEETLLFLKHTDGCIYPVYSNEFGDYTLIDLIMGTDKHDMRRPVAKITHAPSSAPHTDIFYLKGHEPPEVLDNCVVNIRSDLTMTGCVSRDTGAPITVGPFYRCQANFGETLFDFTNLLKGNFGKTPNLTSLNNQLAFRVGKASDKYEAQYILNWFSKEAEEYKTSDAILTNIATSRALEQATSLYAAKYAVLRIMYGHLLRLIQGK